MRPDRLTVKAQEALQTAQQQAERRQHPQLDVEHLLLALATQRDGLIPSLLKKLGAAPDQLTARLDRAIERIPGVSYLSRLAELWADDPMYRARLGILLRLKDEIDSARAVEPTVPM